MTDQIEWTPETLLAARAAEAGLAIGESHPSPDLVAFPLRVEWERTQPPAAADPYPAPIHTSHEGWEIPIPVGAQRLAQFAREASWEVITQCAQGAMPHATTGRPGGLCTTVGLRFGRHPMTDRQAYAVSRRSGTGSWAWDSLMIWGPDLPPKKLSTLAELKAFLLLEKP